jgi:hypothetical protein
MTAPKKARSRGVDPQVLESLADGLEEIRVVARGVVRDLDELVASMRRHAARARRP